jgi:hypothetical protein
MSFKDCAAQIIKLLPTTLTFVSLAMSLPIVKTTIVDCAGPTFGTSDPFRPPQVTDYFKTFCIIDEVLDIDHSRILSDLIAFLSPP